jgi:hypothetical protein
MKATAAGSTAGPEHPTAQGDRHVTTRFLATSAPEPQAVAAGRGRSRTRRMHRPQRPSSLHLHRSTGTLRPIWHSRAAFMPRCWSASIWRRWSPCPSPRCQEIAAMTERLLEEDSAASTIWNEAADPRHPARDAGLWPPGAADGRPGGPTSWSTATIRSMWSAWSPGTDARGLHRRQASAAHHRQDRLAHRPAHR